MSKVGTREYDLILRPDKDSGHVQWYYFMVANVRKNVSYVINIVNFVKNKSLYNQGLKPLLYSTKDADRKKIGWKRAGSRCVYYSRGNRYTLTFTIEFDHDRDVCFLAHCYPYVYTDLQLFLSSLENDVSRKKTVLRKELCRSLAGNQVDLLIISDDPQNWQKNSKQSIFLTARVHPGETQASWAMQGCIEFLTSNSPEALFLRQKYNFFVVPMLNPDGVINGHYRCSLAGQDLNRIWQNPDFTRHPCIWHTKNLMKNLLSKKLIFFCDFHGHSTKKNAFMYGCDPNACFPGKVPVHQWKNPNSPCNFPMIMNEISTAFSFQDCDFRMHKSKLTTGRVVVYREFGITQSYTFEVSFLGHKISDNMVHFNITDLLQLGQHFGLAFMKLLCSCESG
ncbi:hypothetical protein GUITHDRAFT_89476 [Guillardia theta CCMP2712]|uniref:Peptidase M14 domain-containing protein n=2 Tax=Guillardia theta TaxID=55529 RepID=L1IQ69_GUITC|nr:hypothetical protein GUITHDRAFT_89476 [Guillardia theta CCMP2712]EKX38029.1 hypothetical protein GUITHDRAFT_89476 [Guillardia theta CCMP2712]|eukprot:XP_005825009.1 hypothetical protein GUITHDRAFT_89476 [Guillardia theta CCMP2712]